MQLEYVCRYVLIMVLEGGIFSLPYIKDPPQKSLFLSQYTNCESKYCSLFNVIGISFLNIMLAESQ